MFGSRPHLGFPRKVVAYYLLFCLVAVAWLAAGVVVTSHTVANSRAINSCLSRLGKTAAAIEIEYLRHRPEKLATIVQRTKAEASLSYCAVISPEGTILAHSTPELVGAHATLPTGSLLRWGEVTGTRFVDEEGQILREYRVGLVSNGDHFGSLHLAVVEPNVWNTLAETAHVAPLAVLVPLALVAVGAVVLSRTVSPMAGVELQLRTVAQRPPGSPLELAPLRARDATSLGWNQVVELVARLQRESGGSDLQERLAQAVAARKQNDLAEILQNLQDGIAVTDAEGRITFANRAIAALLGEDLTPEGLQGLEFAASLKAQARCAADSPLFDPQACDRAAVSELQREEGEAGRVLRIARQPLRSEHRKGQVWSLRDITQQKLAEKMRDQFIDTATHELRTPLSNIKAYAETLATCSTIEVEQQKEFCNIINSEVTRLARFVDDLLSISSMEVGSLSADRQKVETARLFSEVLAKVKPLMVAKQIKFEVRLPEKMGDLKLDKEKMVAVMVNLLGNAAKYTPSGGHVSLKVQIDSQHLQIAVTDTGVGIAANELPMVFEKFFRSSDERVQSESGTGLGLSLAREVVRMHGGDIRVESQFNQGSTFLVTIPVE
jgi:two-component system phosphate regulon sensor histidine kinase PhoR